MEKADKKSGKRVGREHLGESLGCTHAQALSTPAALVKE